MVTRLELLEVPYGDLDGLQRLLHLIVENGLRVQGLPSEADDEVAQLLHEDDDPGGGVVVLAVCVHQADRMHQRRQQRSHINKVGLSQYLQHRLLVSQLTTDKIGLRQLFASLILIFFKSRDQTIYSTVHSVGTSGSVINLKVF